MEERVVLDKIQKCLVMDGKRRVHMPSRGWGGREATKTSGECWGTDFPGAIRLVWPKKGKKKPRVVTGGCKSSQQKKRI